MIRGQRKLSRQEPVSGSADGSMRTLGLQPDPVSESTLELELKRNAFAPGTARAAVGECLAENGIE
jgi:hypothetical protein